MDNAETDRLYSAWRRLGVNFTGSSSADPVEIEPLILDTARAAGSDARLTICAASWLAYYHSFVDGRRLSELTRHAKPAVRPYLGILLSLAVEASEGAGKAPEFDAALSHCKPRSHPRALYDSVEASPVMRAWMRAHGLPLYRRWGFWHDDATLKKSSVHELGWILKVPELRARALCGPSIEAALLAQAMHHASNARSLSRELGVSYAAAHAAIERLVGRGLLLRQRNGVRQDLSLSSFAREALQAGS